MSVVTISWNVSLFIAPGLSGILYGHGLWGWEHQYPHLLPNLLAAGMCLLASGFVVFFLPETRCNREKYVKLEPITPHSSEQEIVQRQQQPQQQISHLAILNPLVLSSLFLVFLLYLWSVSFDEVVNLFAIANVKSGGLGWKPSQLGICLSCAAVFVVVFTLFVYPIVLHRFGKITCLMFSSVCIAVLSSVIPFTSLLPSHVIWGAVLCLLGVTKVCSSMCFTGVFLIVNQSVEKSLRGRLNGLSTTVGSIAAAIGPAAIAPLFAWSVDQLKVPCIGFILCSVVMGVVVISVGAHHRVKHRTQEANENSSDEIV
eukprot:c4545_g1_i2.p1 GENE.c4545_g1_i2~~c4545_g1_i2.p1  ORF type:complete len:314 (+),score=63.59 c4545_g1_i2:435-1376(+)